MAIQRFSSHRRAERTIGPITGKSSEIAAANGSQKPIDPIPSLIRDANARSFCAGQRHDLPAHWTGVALVSGPISPTARACVLRRERIVDRLDYGWFKPPVATHGLSFSECKRGHRVAIHLR